MVTSKEIRDAIRSKNIFFLKSLRPSELLRFIDLYPDPESLGQKAGEIFSPLLDLCAIDNSGSTSEQTLEILDFLLNNGAKINSKNSRGNSPLYLAVKYQSPEFIKKLLKREADVLTENNAHETIIHKLLKEKSNYPLNDILDLIVPRILSLNERFFLDHTNLWTDFTSADMAPRKQILLESVRKHSKNRLYIEALEHLAGAGGGIGAAAGAGGGIGVAAGAGGGVGAAAGAGGGVGVAAGAGGGVAAGAGGGVEAAAGAGGGVGAAAGAGGGVGVAAGAGGLADPSPEQKMVDIENIFKAIRRGDVEFIREIQRTKPHLLHERFPNAGNRSDSIHTPLSEICSAPVSYDEAKRREILETILNAGAPINAQNHRGNSALYLSVRYRDPLFIKILISNNADIFAINEAKETIFHKLAKDEPAFPLAAILEVIVPVAFSLNETLLQRIAEDLEGPRGAIIGAYVEREISLRESSAPTKKEGGGNDKTGPSRSPGGARR